jgi:hypothetical protein
MPSHNPQPFLVLSTETKNAEMKKFVAMLTEETLRNIKLNKPVLTFAKWDLPTKKEAEDFIRLLMRRLQLATKQVYTKTLHYSQLTTPETKPNQLDVAIGIGIRAEDFAKVLRQVILMTYENKDGVGVTVKTEESQGGEATADTGGIDEEDTEIVREAEVRDISGSSQENTQCDTLGPANGSVGGTVDRCVGAGELLPPSITLG